MPLKLINSQPANENTHFPVVVQNPKPMFRNLLCLLLSAFMLTATAQQPTTVFSIANKNIVIPCDSTCTSITATVPHIKQSDDYLVQFIPYQPYAYAAGGTELTDLYSDDRYSSIIGLPFPFCFYGTTYSSLVVGSNGIVSFDVTNAGKRNNFSQIVSFFDSTAVQIPYAGGLQNTLTRTYYPKAAIMGVFHDIYPTDNSTGRRIEWRIEGTAPRRRFIASYKDVPLYGCTSLTATHQMVVYESTGIIEVYVQDKPVCPAWNGGLAILGVQNAARNKAAFPAGKNASQWGSTGMKEAYRFLPTAGTARFKKAELLSDGTVIALADTASGTPGELQLNFGSICPTADSVQYILRTTYNSCSSPTGEVSFEDTVYVRKEKLNVNLQVENPTCTTGGVITADATGTASSFAYVLNNAPEQASNVFSGLKAGAYEIAVSSSTCTRKASTTLVLQNDLSLSAQTTAVICAGETFTPQVSSNAGSFSWSPSTGISNSSEASPQIKAPASTTYTITATKGDCQQSTVLNVTVKPLPTVNAGSDQTIVQGDVVQLAATASAGAYAWTPATGLSSASLLNPTAMPATTTTYRLTATANGCSASDDVTVNVELYCIKPMEAFTPNSDGINDLWLVSTGGCLQQAKVDVFNRYGAKVYHSDDYHNNWNGTYQGKPLPDGTYYYVITCQLINNKTVYLKGNVTILR